jgi:hypothetical protein
MMSQKWPKRCIWIVIYDDDDDDNDDDAYFINVSLLVYTYYISINIPYCMDMEHIKWVTNLPSYIPWAFSFLQHLSATRPLLDTNKVMYAQIHLLGL